MTFDLETCKTLDDNWALLPDNTRARFTHDDGTGYMPLHFVAEKDGRTWYVEQTGEIKGFSASSDPEYMRNFSASGPKTITITPTWTSILPLLLAGLESGTPEGKRLAREELLRMAQAADHAVSAS